MINIWEVLTIQLLLQSSPEYEINQTAVCTTWQQFLCFHKLLYAGKTGDMQTAKCHI